MSQTQVQITPLLRRITTVYGHKLDYVFQLEFFIKDEKWWVGSLSQSPFQMAERNIGNISDIKKKQG